MTRARELAKVSTAYETGGAFGHRNKIINGAMNINQRVGYAGTPTPGVLSYSIDRWGVGVGSGSTALTVSQVSTGGLSGFPYCAKVQRNSGQTNTASIYFVQQIESVNMMDLQGKTISVSFSAKAGANYSASSGNLTAYVTYGTGTDQASWGALGGWTGFTLTTPISTALTTSFQRFTGTTTVPSNANEMAILLVFTPTGTAGADDSFSVTGVQLEAGRVATPFEMRQYGTELALCERYYEIAVGGWYMGNAGATFVGGGVNFRQTKRVSPTVTFAYNVTAPNNLSSNPYAEAINNQGFRSMALVASNGNANWQAAYTASAEL